MTNQRKKPKVLKFLKITAATLACTFTALISFMVVVQATRPKNPFIVEKGERPLVAAHRGGSLENPENTMRAFRDAVYKYNVDIIETDIYITKDGHLVCTHDPYIDEKCNVNGNMPLKEVHRRCSKSENKELYRHYVADMTLAQLKKYNFGYFFRDKSGKRLYENVKDIEAEGLQIITLDQLFAEFRESHPNLLFSVELKNGGEQGKRACAALKEVFEKFPEYKNRVLVSTFQDAIEAELRFTCPELMRSAATASARNFVLSKDFGIDFLYEGDFTCLQVPIFYDTGAAMIRLDNKEFIDKAHRNNVAVQYWTINKPEEMRKLIEIGCDCIITDDLELINQILKEYE